MGKPNGSGIPDTFNVVLPTHHGKDPTAHSSSSFFVSLNNVVLWDSLTERELYCPLVSSPPVLLRKPTTIVLFFSVPDGDEVGLAIVLFFNLNAGPNFSNTRTKFLPGPNQKKGLEKKIITHAQSLGQKWLAKPITY